MDTKKLREILNKIANDAYLKVKKTEGADVDQAIKEIQELCVEPMSKQALYQFLLDNVRIDASVAVGGEGSSTKLSNDCYDRLASAIVAKFGKLSTPKQDDTFKALGKVVRTANNEIIAITYEGKQYYPKELHPSILSTPRLTDWEKVLSKVQTHIIGDPPHEVVELYDVLSALKSMSEPSLMEECSCEDIYDGLGIIKDAKCPVHGTGKSNPNYCGHSTSEATQDGTLKKILDENGKVIPRYGETLRGYTGKCIMRGAQGVNGAEFGIKVLSILENDDAVVMISRK